MTLARKQHLAARGRLALRVLAPALFGALVLASLGCFPSHPQSTFDAAGPVAKSQLDLFYIIFWAAVFVFVVVGGVLLYATIRFRRRPEQEIPVQTHGNTRLEIAWTIAPAIVLAVIAVPTVITIFDNARTPDLEEAVSVRVIAHQWWWEFEYLSKEELEAEEADLKLVKKGDLERADAYRAKPYVVTANELHVPVGVPVNVILESSDVIHSFWIPKLAGKVDMVPNNRNTMWFQADRADADPTTPEQDPFRGQCAELCGVAHALMKFLVFADEQQDFDQWVRAQQAPPVEPATTLAEEGNKAYVQQRCWACHTIEGVMGRGDRGPNLTHLGSRTTIGAGLLQNTEEHLTDWLRDPLAMKPGNIMGSEGEMFQTDTMPMIDRDVEALVVYLLSLK